MEYLKLLIVVVSVKLYTFMPVLLALVNLEVTVVAERSNYSLCFPLLYNHIQLKVSMIVPYIS